MERSRERLFAALGFVEGGGRATPGCFRKLLLLKDAVKLLDLGEDSEITLSDRSLTQAVPGSIAPVNPGRFVSIECSCSTESDPAPGPHDRYIVIGDPAASFLLKEGIGNPREISKEEAESIMKGEPWKGKLLCGLFDSWEGGSLVVICTCSRCCDGTIEEQGVSRSGYYPQINRKCLGCGACENACPNEAISIGYAAEIKLDRCTGCGLCLVSCKFRAIDMLVSSEVPPVGIRR